MQTIQPHILFMESPNVINYEPPYRQLDQVARAMVDDLISRVEKRADVTGQALFDVLGKYEPTERELTFIARPIVKAAIYERIRDLTDAQNISPRRIVKEIAAIAFGSIDHFRRPGGLLHDGLIDDDGRAGGLFELDYATPEQRAAVKEVEIEEQVRTGKVKTKLKLHDKLGALRMLGQIQGLFDADGNVTNSEKWAEAGGIPVSATAEDAEQIYARLISDV